MPQDKYIKYVPAEATMKRIGKWHVRLYRATRGLIGKRLDGLDMLLLTTTGKKTGISRTVPLPYFRDGSNCDGNCSRPCSVVWPSADL